MMRLLGFLFVLSSFCFGAGGLQKANTLMQNLSTALYGLAGATVVVACIYVGFKIMWGGKTLQECAPVLIGSGIIICASSLGAMLIN